MSPKAMFVRELLTKCLWLVHQITLSYQQYRGGSSPFIMYYDKSFLFCNLSVKNCSNFYNETSPLELEWCFCHIWHACFWVEHPNLGGESSEPRFSECAQDKVEPHPWYCDTPTTELPFTTTCFSFLRLSYHKRIAEMCPPEFEAILPAEPKKDFKYLTPSDSEFPLIAHQANLKVLHANLALLILLLYRYWISYFV